jgi:DNA-binding FadR family transcriptional regulator
MGSTEEQSGARARRAVRPQKTALLLARRIVSEITDRDLQPGATLPPEGEMLAQYGVARGTLREALRFLESQGILTIKPGPGGGPVVTDPDPRYLASTLGLMLQITRAPYRTVLEARQIIEPALAARAAQVISPEQARSLRASVDAMSAAVGDADAFLQENDRFHALIASVAGNELFEQLMASLSWIMDGTAVGVDYPRRPQENVVDRHRAIAEAIATGDAPRAESEMRGHIDEYARYLDRRYPEVLNQPLRWDGISI